MMPRLAHALVLLGSFALGCGSATLKANDGGAGQGGGAAGASGGAGAGGGAGASGGAPSVGGHGGGGGHPADAGSGVDMAAGSTWCAQQAMPAGVAATDYACLDFDGGKLPSGGGWTSTVASGGVSMVTTQKASSLPDGWQTSVGTGDGSKAALAWHTTGAQAVASVTVSADVSPIAPQGVSAPWTGSVSLLCVSFGAGTACLQYTMGQDTGFASGYTGYYLMMEYVGSAATLNTYQVYGTLQPGLWNRIEMQVTASSKQIQVTIPGVTNTPFSGYFDPDTSVDVTVGPQTSGATAGWSGYFDNVVVAVARSS